MFVLLCVALLLCPDNVELTPEAQAKAVDSLREYVNFINSIEDVRIRRKTEAQLGQKVLQLRQALSIDRFSEKFGLVVATDRLVVAKTPPVAN